MKIRSINPEEGGLGFIAGCPVSTVIIIGKTRPGHNDECMLRVMQEGSKSEDGAMRVKASREREQGFLAKHLEVSEKKRFRSKPEEPLRSPSNPTGGLSAPGIWERKLGLKERVWKNTETSNPGGKPRGIRHQA